MSGALNIAAYLADAAILTTYFLMARRPERALWFHVANAIGCIPLLAVEVLAHAWPAVPLTASFGAIGALGVWSAGLQRRRRVR